MAIGAIPITAGWGSAPGTLCGGITVAQRMTASLPKSGVAMIVEVTGPENKTGKTIGIVRRVFLFRAMVNKGSLRCITVAIPVNHIYHGGYYEKQITISLRLSNEEYSILESNGTNLNMTISQYIRSSINPHYLRRQITDSILRR